jgi:hypothetical protein
MPYLTTPTTVHLPLTPKYNIPPEELAKIPQEYRRHLKVFSEVATARLPPSRPWDHAINLKPGAPSAIKGCIYPLTQLELAELDKHIDGQLAKGYMDHPKPLPITTHIGTYVLPTRP